MNVKHLVATVFLATLADNICFAQEQAVAFVNANVITMENDRVVADQTLVVRDGRIAQLGGDIALQGDEKVIDVDGGYLMPGLVEMHAHVPPVAQEQYMTDVLFLWLAHGITSARGMLGEPGHLALRDELLEHKVAGPRLYTAGPSFNGNTVQGSAQARKRVREQKAAGYDFLKLHGGLSRESFDALADEAHQQGIPFVGHVSLDVGLLHSMASGQKTIEHMDGYMQALVPDAADHPDAAVSFFGVDLAPRIDESRIGPLVEATRQAGARVVPTQTLMNNIVTPLSELRAREQNQYLPRALLARYEESIERLGGNDNAAAMNAVRLRLIKRLHDAGVPVLLGSDAPQIFNVPGFSLHRELQTMVAAGLSNYEALAAGTVKPADYFENNTGILAVGKDADIILLDANPLENIEHSTSIKGVMVRGRWFDRETLDKRLEDIATRSRETTVNSR